MKRDMLFYNRLESLVAKSNQSFNQIERTLGYPRNALNNYKKGVEPSGTRLIELSHYFGVSPEYLLGIEKEKRSKLLSLDCFFYNLQKSQKKELSQLCCKWLLNQED